MAKKYSVAILRKKLIALGISGPSFDGAFFGKDGEYTEDGAMKIIKQWQKEEVK